jgi:hypothetical protein
MAAPQAALNNWTSQLRAMHHLPASKSLIALAQPSALPTVPTSQLAPSHARPANANSKINRNVEAEYATLEAANKERHQAEEKGEEIEELKIPCAKLCPALRPSSPYYVFH